MTQCSLEGNGKGSILNVWSGMGECVAVCKQKEVGLLCQLQLERLTVAVDVDGVSLRLLQVEVLDRWMQTLLTSKTSTSPLVLTLEPSMLLRAAQLPLQPVKLQWVNLVSSQQTNMQLWLI